MCYAIPLKHEYGTDYSVERIKLNIETFSRTRGSGKFIPHQKSNCRIPADAADVNATFPACQRFFRISGRTSPAFTGFFMPCILARTHYSVHVSIISDVNQFPVEYRFFSV
jgi:hypothetical protein